MAAFIVHPIAPGVVDAVRLTRHAPEYGHPAHEEIAGGTGPCRACLRAFDVGAENRLLFTYSPFDRAHFLSQPGPVFIHATACEPHDGAGYPPGLRDIHVVAQAHHVDGSAGRPHPLPCGDEAETLDRLLADSAVAFVHLRHGEAGCFIARVDRA